VKNPDNPAMIRVREDEWCAVDRRLLKYSFVPMDLANMRQNTGIGGGATGTAAAAAAALSAAICAFVRRLRGFGVLSGSSALSVASSGC
jgi:hypothetical protein